MNQKCTAAPGRAREEQEAVEALVGFAALRNLRLSPAQARSYIRRRGLDGARQSVAAAAAIVKGAR